VPSELGAGYASTGGQEALAADLGNAENGAMHAGVETMSRDARRSWRTVTRPERGILIEGTELFVDGGEMKETSRAFIVRELVVREDVEETVRLGKGHDSSRRRCRPKSLVV